MGTAEKQDSDSLKKGEHILSLGMLKKGDVIDDKDDEVRTSASQNHASATLCT
jgi:hypothetical protein